MPIVDTTGTIDSSIYLKAKLDKNMVGSNYYIESLQQKRDKDWAYRYNRIDIEEELSKQIFYTPEQPNYTPIEVVIRNVKSINGSDLGTDWANISFRDLKHPCNEGSRYRFSLDFPDTSKMSENDKHYSTSIWICVNKTPIRAGNTITLRRCDSTLTLLGSTSGNREDITEMHLEPVVLENDNKFVQTYYNMQVPVPQAEFYATMQCNYFTNHIKLNDRFLLGTLDPNNRENNTVVKVKAINKATTEHTFVRNSEDELESTTLIFLSLDKDMISPDDDIINRIASNAPVYKSYQQAPINIPYIKPIDDESMEEHEEAQEEANNFKLGPINNLPFNRSLMLGEECEYKFALYKNGYEYDETELSKFSYSYELSGIKEENWNKYFTIVDSNDTENGYFGFKVKNLKACNRGKLLVRVIYSGEQEVNYDCEIKLTSFYE